MPTALNHLPCFALLICPSCLGLFDQHIGCFSLSPEEKIFGCGESFTQLDKRGQKVVLWADDANGVQNESMYKPIHFL